MLLVFHLWVPDFCNSFLLGASRIQGGSNWPEVHIVTLKNEELASDALSVLGYEHCEAKDYSLAHAPFVGTSSSAFGPSFYIHAISLYE